MNDIIKVILLNFILIYFLIKKNKSISMFLIVVLFMYLLYLRGNKLLEGQDSIDEKKDEVKFMKMANLDRLLGKLLNVYEHSEEDCIGEYTDFTPCDKKCGITHKYKTYRVERPAGLFGKSCVEEDGRRKKELCDESDGVYKCIIGESCQEDGDCDSDNCDPRTDRCVPEKVCSNTNLDLCNKEECIDLNNHYDYAKREFKYDETEPGVKCKLEDKETDTDTENEEEEDDIAEGGLDPSIIAAADCETSELYWYLEPQDRDLERVTSAGCKLKIPGSVFYESEESQDFQERKIMYGLNDMSTGLYCKIGYKFCPNQSTGVEGDEPSQTEETDDPDDPEGGGDETDICSTLDDMVGISSPILPEYISDISSRRLSNYCTSKIDRSECPPGAWPPYSYFESNRNPESYDENLTIPIIDRCKRCDNGWYKSGDECTQCKDGSSPDSSPVETINQYKLVGNDYINIEDGVMGNNTSCLEYGDADSLTCRNSGYQCDYRNMLRDDMRSPDSTVITSLNDFWGTCCKNCDKNQKFDTNAPSGCSTCPPGQKQSAAGNECVDCPPGSKFSPADDTGTCSECLDDTIVSDSGDNCLNSMVRGEYCSNWDILNEYCVAKSGSEGAGDQCVYFNCGVEDKNRRQIYLDYYNENEQNFNQRNAPTYENCCKFSGCKAGSNARSFDNINKVHYCKECPDVCGNMSDIIKYKGIASSKCSCHPMDSIDSQTGEFNIGPDDEGTWIFLVSGNIVSVPSDVRYVDTDGDISNVNLAGEGRCCPSIIGRKNGRCNRGEETGDEWGDIPNNITSPRPQQQIGDYLYDARNGEWHTISGRSTTRIGHQEYASKWFTGKSTAIEHFYFKIWNHLKDVNVTSGESPQTVKDVSIAVYLSKEDLCHYCESGKLVLDYDQLRWTVSGTWDVRDNWIKFQQDRAAFPIIIDLSTSRSGLSYNARRAVCQFCEGQRLEEGVTGYTVPDPPTVDLQTGGVVAQAEVQPAANTGDDCDSIVSQIPQRQMSQDDIRGLCTALNTHPECCSREAFNIRIGLFNNVCDACQYLTSHR